MDVSEGLGGNRYVENGGVMVATDLVDLASMSGTGPEGNFPMHVVPHKTVAKETLGCADAWVQEA